MKYKPYGVTAEPEVKTKLLNGMYIIVYYMSWIVILQYERFADIILFFRNEGPEWAYAVFVTDGVSSVLTDQEIVDLGRNAKDPRSAAKSILDFAEEMGSEDNGTVLVLPLAGWGKIRGPDRTKRLREYRREEMSTYKLFLVEFTSSSSRLQSEARGIDECRSVYQNAFGRYPNLMLLGVILDFDVLLPSFLLFPWQLTQISKVFNDAWARIRNVYLSLSATTC